MSAFVKDIIVAGIAWSAVMFLVIHDISMDWPGEVDKNASAANGADKKSRDSKPIRPLSVANDHSWDAEQRHHYKRERIYWRHYLAITFVGLVGAFFAVYYARRAFFEAHRQAEIANRSLHISERAYIVVSELRQESSTLGVGYFHIVPVIRNSGPTPATDVNIITMTPDQEFLRSFYPRNAYIDGEVAWAVRASRDPAEISSDTDSKEGRLTNLVIGPGSTLTASELGVDLPITAGVQAQSNRIGRYMYGQITYLDVFRSRHVSKYCFTIDGVMTGGPNGLTPLQSTCSHWNCIDQGCDADRKSYLSQVAAALKDIHYRSSPPPSAQLRPRPQVQLPPPPLLLKPPSKAKPAHCPGVWMDCQ